MISRNPLVSIIIPTYNRANFVSQSIESVLKQTYRNFEILVVDDGSIDNTQQILKSYIEREMIRYFYKENKGVSSARNLGIREARGDYIAFLDSDDMYHPEKLEKQVEYMGKHSADLGMSFTNYKVINEKRKTLFCVDKRKRYPSEILSLEHVIEEPGLLLSTVMIKKEVFTIAGTFDERLLTAEDTDFFLRVAKSYRIGLLPISLTDFRHHEKGRLSNRLSGYEDLIFVLKRFARQNSGYCDGRYKISIKRAFSRAYLDYGKELLWLGHVKEAKNKLKLSLSYKISSEVLRSLFKAYLKALL